MPQASAPPPRIFCIPATSAPVVAVLRRGPTDWWQLSRWALDPPALKPGAWFRAQLYPQKCDLSPDGRWFAYSALNPGADWPAGTIYEAVSRLPWLHALVAWEAGTTYTRGIHFTRKPGESALGEPDVGDAKPLLRRYGIALNRPEQFSVERRHGWTEAEDSETRDPGDTWDEKRRVRMRKSRPRSGTGKAQGEYELLVEGSYAAFRSLPDLREPGRYLLRSAEGEVPLTDIQWADWDEEGRFLAATRDGRLQIHAEPWDLSNPKFDYDLSTMAPDPAPPPSWAEEW